MFGKEWMKLEACHVRGKRRRQKRSRKEKGSRGSGRGELGREALAMSRQRQAQQGGPRSAGCRGGNHAADPQIRNVGKNASATIVVNDTATPRQEGNWVFITEKEKAVGLSCLLQSFHLYLQHITCICAEKGAGDVIYMCTCEVWIVSFTLAARLHPERIQGESAPAIYLLQLVHELLVARILTASGLDQAVTQVLSDHLGGVQVSEDAGKQM